MKNKITNPLRIFLIAIACLVFSIPAMSLTGCGPSDPTESSMDRIPNVPASNRSQGKSKFPSEPKK